MITMAALSTPKLTAIVVVIAFVAKSSSGPSDAAIASGMAFVTVAVLVALFRGREGNEPFTRWHRP